MYQIRVILPQCSRKILFRTWDVLSKNWKIQVHNIMGLTCNLLAFMYPVHKIFHA